MFRFALFSAPTTRALIDVTSVSPAELGAIGASMLSGTPQAAATADDILASAIKALHGATTGPAVRFFGDNGRNMLTIDADLAADLSLAGGSDRLTSNATITGKIDLGVGADVYDGSRGTAAGGVDGGAGRDLLTGGDGNDILSGGTGNDLLRGGDGFDFLTGGAHHDMILGGLGNDILQGNQGVDQISGGAGDDHLSGGAGTDQLSGGAGNDRLDGGTGSDKLSGGAGSDVFIFAAGGGRDLITDFDANSDMLHFDGLGTDAEILAMASEHGQNLVFDFGGGDRLVIRDTDLTDLNGLLGG